MATQGRKISQLADELPRYEIVKTKLNLDRERIRRAFESLTKHFTDATASRLDGLRLDWPDKWLLMRPSNTEPIVRVIAEARSRELAVDLCEQVGKIVSS